MARRSSKRASALVFAGLLLAGCGSRTYYTPEIAGVVVETRGTNSASLYQLANGQRFTIDITNSKVIVYGGGPPDVGDLLLGGTGPDGAWVARLHKDVATGGSPDCFVLGSFGTDHRDTIEMDVGLRLPKAPQFDPGPIGPVDGVKDGTRYEWSPSKFCVNSDGQVTSFG